MKNEAITSLESKLFKPVDAVFLALFRILYGCTMLERAWFHIARSTKFDTWFFKTDLYYLKPDFLFSYHGLEWIQPFPGAWMYVFFVAMLVLAGCVTLGFCYRISSILLCIGYVYAFALDKALYMNHYYLLCLVSILMCLVPAQCMFSVDAWRKPSLRSDVVPEWTLWLLRMQVGVPYFFGGLAKLNADWLRGEPVRQWMYSGSMGVPGFLQNDWGVWLVSYGGALFDLLIVPALLYRRTRLPAYVVACIFHLLNSQLFKIGVFPWFMLFATLVYFPPEWHRRALKRLFPFVLEMWEKLGRTDAPGANGNRGPATSALYESMCVQPRGRYTLCFLAVYLGFQFLWPLRCHLYDGDPAWTGKGEYFAWRMMLYDKQTDLKFFRSEPAESQSAGGPEHEIEIPMTAIEIMLNSHQVTMLQRDPDLMLQLAHFLARKYRGGDGGPDAEIYVHAAASLNTRRPQLQIEPNANLAAINRTAFGPTPWIMPFEDTPLHDLPRLPAAAKAVGSPDDESAYRYSSSEWE